MRRFALAPFPLLALVQGLSYVLGGTERTSGPSFDVAKTLGHNPAALLDLTPMQLWGLLFLTGAATLATAILIGHDRLLHHALLVGGGIYLWWAVVHAAAIRHGGSLNSWSVYGFIAITHYVAAHYLKVRSR